MKFYYREHREWALLKDYVEGVEECGVGIQGCPGQTIPFYVQDYPTYILSHTFPPRTILYNTFERDIFRVSFKCPPDSLANHRQVIRRISFRKYLKAVGTKAGWREVLESFLGIRFSVLFFKSRNPPKETFEGFCPPTIEGVANDS